MKKYLILTIVAAMIALVIIFPTQPIEEDFEVPAASVGSMVAGKVAGIASAELFSWSGPYGVVAAEVAGTIIGSVGFYIASEHVPYDGLGDRL